MLYMIYSKGECHLTTLKLVRASLIAALYVVLVLIFNPISFGPIQCRVAEGLTVLPFIFPEAVPGLFIGCLIANIFGGSIWDIIAGSLATLLAAWLTSKAPNLYWAAVPPVVVNALVVGSYLGKITDIPFYLAIPYVAVGQAIACFGIGIPLVRLLQKVFFTGSSYKY